MIKVGCAFGTQRDELTLRFARTEDQTSSYPQERKFDRGWEDSIHISHPKKLKSLGSPMRNAPAGAEAELQRVLLKKEKLSPLAALPLAGLIVIELLCMPFRRSRPPPEAETSQ